MMGVTINMRTQTKWDYPYWSPTMTARWKKFLLRHFGVRLRLGGVRTRCVHFRSSSGSSHGRALARVGARFGLTTDIGLLGEF